MDKKDFIKWLVKKGREAEGTWRYRFVKMYSNSEDFWQYHKPSVDELENTINLETDGKVIYEYDMCLGGEIKRKEFTYEEFINTNIEEIE